MVKGEKKMKIMIMIMVMFVAFICCDYITVYSHETAHEEVSKSYGFEIVKKEVNVFGDSYVITKVNSSNPLYGEYKQDQNSVDVIGYHIISLQWSLFVIFFLYVGYSEMRRKK